MKTILVAEDDPPSRELMLAILDGEGYTVVEAVDGGDALRKIEQTPPDLILLDIQMPVMDGFAVLDWLRQRPLFAHLPVVALTAHAMREDQDRIRTAGFNAHISKPIDRRALLARIHELLGGKEES